MTEQHESGCPECGSLKLEASSKITKCRNCGHRFQSGLQDLANRFI